MKITEYDLDAKLAEKINRLEGIVSSFDGNDPDGFISYGKDGFYFKKTNDTFLKRVYTEDDIIDLDRSLGSDKANITSTALADIRSDRTVFNSAVKDFLYELDVQDRKEFDGRILLHREFSQGIIVYTDKGTMYYAGKSIDVFRLISETFNMAASMRIYSIVDFAEIDPDNIIVATSSMGIYKVSMADNSVELITGFDAVRRIEVSHSGDLFIFSDNTVAVYEIKTGLCIEKYNNMHNHLQIPWETMKVASGIYAIGKPIGMSGQDSLLHFWELDRAGKSYNMKDSLIERNPSDNRYQPLSVYRPKQGGIMVSGLFGDKIFIWSYDNGHALKETMLDCVPAKDMTGFLPIEGGYLVLCGRDLYVVKGKSLDCHFRLPCECRDLMDMDNGIAAISDNALVRIELPEFEARATQLAYDILNISEKCNNIDIYIKGATRNERISIIDQETGKEIAPSYYIVYDGCNSVIKLINCQAKRIGLTIMVNPASKIAGIVVKRNRMFLR